MDPLSDVISLLKPESYHVGGFCVGGEWSVRFPDHRGIKCYAVTSGTGWLAVNGVDNPVKVETGDCFVLPRGWSFTLASDLALPPQDWREFLAARRVGVITQLKGDGDVTIVGGHFLLAGQQAKMLLDMLPPIMHLRSDADRVTLHWAFDRLREELSDQKPGGALIAQQLAYMILIQAIRLHLDSGQGVGWLFALSDKNIGAAITAIHREPSRRWTVEMLAEEVGMSRSGFAARFRQLVGDGPIDYLTRWRMLLAERALSQGETVGAVAQSLGYESESAFSTAFKRVMGSSPRQHARQALEAAV